MKMFPWLIDKREMEQAQLFETADERGCTPMFGAAHRRESACIGGFPPPAGLRLLPSALGVSPEKGVFWKKRGRGWRPFRDTFTKNFFPPDLCGNKKKKERG